jgi:hypothetical protein
MPFRPELNFFYLYLRRHLRENHALQVERADHRFSTKPLLEKIREQLKKADLVIGDISGRNANVFYELGLADAYGKPVILITQDSAEEVPSDVRHLEFIRYDLEHDAEFLAKLDSAVRSVFAERYKALYAEAVGLLKQFNADTGSTCEQRSQEVFQANVTEGEAAQGIPEPVNQADRVRFLLPRILMDTTDADVMRRLTEWFESKFPKLAP